MSDATTTTDSPAPAGSRWPAAVLVALIVLLLEGLLVGVQVWAWFHISTYWFIGLCTVLVPVGLIAAHAGVQMVARARNPQP